VLWVVASAALAALLVLACWFDVRSRRIPNVLTVAGIGAALVLRGVAGAGELLDGMLGAFLALLLAVLPFALGVLGGGDVKLLVAVGGFLGLERLPGALLAIALLGGGLALIEAVRQRVLRRALASTYAYAKYLAFFGRFGMAPAMHSAHALTVPYGIAIAAGSLAWWFLGGVNL